MVDDVRKAEMRQYQQQRSAVRRRHNLVTRTCWIWERDSDDFRAAVAPFVDRARMIESLLGTAPLPSLELVDLVKKHRFPYDPADIVFLAELRTQLALKPGESTDTKARARDILARYDLPIALEDLIS